MGFSKSFSTRWKRRYQKLCLKSRSWRGAKNSLVGGANITNTLFNGSVSLSFIPQTAPVIPEVPEVEPSPESPEQNCPK
ncbi:hypothetical protein [Helicobacter cinaedi]|uniref:hypothetical protein n=1 Tax=Helicobacter cinaedi TaxID=213 RepID=UPI00215DB291|nr:hypothetical protein [Helicobacter cinaedi]